MTLSVLGLSSYTMPFIAIGQPYRPGRKCGLIVDSCGAGSGVEVGGEVAGRGEHYRIQTPRAVGLPGGKHLIGQCGLVADVDALVVEVEAERRRHRWRRVADRHQ